MAAAIDTANSWPNSGEAGFKHSNDSRADGKHVPHDSALSVSGVDDQGMLVRELQEEVKVLTERVAGASQRFADYENEIRVLQAQVRQEKRRNAQSEEASNPEQAAATQAQKPGISRFGSFMHSRKPVPSPASPSRERELEAALVQEQMQRLAAEKKVKDVTGEIEDLSATLFQQANDMVSTERKENASLKERIQLLEERDAKFSFRVQDLEQREASRKKRMESLESAMQRIERAKGLLVQR